MNQTLRSRLTRAVLPGLAAAAISGSLFAAPASAAVGDDPVTATYSRQGLGLNDVVADANGTYWPAGNDYLKLADGTEVLVYCIDFDNTKVEHNGDYVAKTWPVDGLTAGQMARITDIATHHKQIGKPFAKATWEAAATQVAIWKISNDIAYKKIPNQDFVDRVAQILDGAKADAPTPVLSYALQGKKTVTGEGEKSHDVVEAILTSDNGSPVADQKLVFSVDGEKTTVKTDADGSASLELPRDEAERTVSVNFETAVDAGVVFAPKSGKQPMVAVDGFDVEREISVKVAAFVPEEAPSPTPDVTSNEATKPEPKPSAKPEVATHEQVKRDAIPSEFPHTGAYPLLSGLLGAGALTGLGLLGRRKFRGR